MNFWNSGWLAVAAAKSGGGIQVVLRGLIDAVIADIGDIQREILRKRALDGEIPRFHIGLAELRIDEEVALI